MRSKPSSAALLGSEVFRLNLDAEVVTRLDSGVQAPVHARSCAYPDQCTLLWKLISVQCSFFTDIPACFLRRLLSLHLDLACQEAVALLVLSSWLRSQPACAGNTGWSVQPERLPGCKDVSQLGVWAKQPVEITWSYSLKVFFVLF